MNAPALSVDPGMYGIFIEDAKQHIQVISKLLEQTKADTLNDEALQDCTRACKSINSGAKLCNIPLISELCEAVSVSLTPIINKKAALSTVIVEAIHTAVKIAYNLIETSVEDVPEWINTNNKKIANTIDILTAIDIADEDTQAQTDATSSSTKETPTDPLTDLGIDASMFELFKVEVEAQARSINENLLALENAPDDNSILEPLMRASHSIKGAARMIGFNAIVDLSHRMEDCFVNSQKAVIQIDRNAIDLFLYCNDILGSIVVITDTQLADWLSSNRKAFEICLHMLEHLGAGEAYDTTELVTFKKAGEAVDQPAIASRTTTTEVHGAAKGTHQQGDSSIRIQSERLNRMLAVSNELVVSQQWLQGHLNSLQTLKKRQTELVSSMMRLRQSLEGHELPAEVFSTLQETENRVEFCRQSLHTDINQLDDYDRKSYVLSSKLNQEVTASRMRPFSEGTHGFNRMVRDVSHSLGKEAKLQMDGLDTLVDSDILDKIEAPLTHLLRNAIDHGIETPELRQQQGKNPQGLIKLSAYHNAGKLNISIQDDGKGIDLAQLKSKIVHKGMVNLEMAERLSESEILDFLFLPGFSTREEVTEFSGRGVGLDVVHEVVTSMRGQIQSSSKPGQGMQILLQLPLTLSVLHSLMTEIGGEYYAFPLTRIHAVINIEASATFTLENRRLINFHGKDVDLINTAQALECRQNDIDEQQQLDILVLQEMGEYYALMVDRVVGEANLALHTIDQRLGKLRDVSAAAIADNGRPVLVLDIDDLLLTLQEGLGENRLNLPPRAQKNLKKNLKKILVIDDSITVREVEKNLLEAKGYYVDLAIDGMDGWNTVRQTNYDLVITDIDMPRMNGIELVTMIKNDPRLSSIPVMIVSYKDNMDDRQKGLQAGADYYLPKGSFHDESLIDGVIDLIGEPSK